jgi:hypothetical protein
MTSSDQNFELDRSLSVQQELGGFSTTETVINSPTESSHQLSSLIPLDKLASAPGGKAGLFSTPGTLPLPDHGHHALGLSFSNLTVFGAGSTQRVVETFDIALLRMWDLPGLIKKLLNLKTGAARPLVSEYDARDPQIDLIPAS